MVVVLPADPDYLVARLHGRRARLAEGERLDALCGLHTIGDLAGAVAPGAAYPTIGDFQRGLILQLVQELADFATQLGGKTAAWMAWQRVRYQVENLKVLARALAAKGSWDLARQCLVALPPDLSLNVESLAAADSVEAFVAAAPGGVLREGLEASIEDYQAEPRAIVLESALDRAYFGELLKRSKVLPREARPYAKSIVNQEVDAFHLMLVARGRFNYRLPGEQLARLHIRGTGISQQRFGRMLEAGSLWEIAREAEGRALAPLPKEWSLASEGEGSGSRADLDPATLETLTANRYYQLASRAFRRSHMGLGAVIAFTSLRRIELANLITISEGIRNGMEPAAIRIRLIPNVGGDPHV
jgi:vacuolar-type H+-ATPase subunit C/Vma6